MTYGLSSLCIILGGDCLYIVVLSFKFLYEQKKKTQTVHG